jgi:hypothetical protein
LSPFRIKYTLPGYLGFDYLLHMGAPTLAHFGRLPLEIRSPPTTRSYDAMSPIADIPNRPPSMGFVPEIEHPVVSFPESVGEYLIGGVVCGFRSNVSTAEIPIIDRIRYDQLLVLCLVIVSWLVPDPP